jgi:D-amino-acid dehydrogenase
MSTSHTIVVGGGVIGASTAYFLARRGERVTLLEQNELGSGSSFGNAGQITPGHLPLPQPGTMARNIRWLFKRTSPLYVKPRFDLELLDWLMRFVRACNPRHLRKATAILCQLGEAADELFDELAAELDFGYRKPGRLEVCRGEKSFAAVRAEARLLSDFGFDHEVLTGAEVSRFEPTLTGKVAGAVFFPRSGCCDPHELVLRLAEAARSYGADVREHQEVVGIKGRRGRAKGAFTETAEIDADAVVLACGAWPASFSRQLGVHLRVQPGKGYHLDLERPAKCPTYPVVFVEEKIFTNPMSQVLRLAGTMELSGYNLNQIPDRLEMLQLGAGRYLPQISGARVVSQWCHWRPMTPDGLPVIGVTPNMENVWVATGHGMLGLTQGPSTGKLLAEWITDGQPSIDVRPLRPDRF